MYIVWAPGHESLAGNLAAHAAARAHILRAIPPDSHSLVDTGASIPKRYANILSHYKLGRRTYPTPHPKLTREETVLFRKLQTSTFPHGTLLHSMYPSSYRRNCTFCSAANTLYHMVWECPANPSIPPVTAPNIEQWEAQLRSTRLQDQRRLVSRAKLSAQAHGVLD